MIDLSLRPPCFRAMSAAYHSWQMRFLQEKKIDTADERHLTVTHKKTSVFFFFAYLQRSGCVDESVVGKPDQPGPGGVEHVVVADREVALQDGVAERDAPGRQELV